MDTLMSLDQNKSVKPKLVLSPSLIYFSTIYSFLFLTILLANVVYSCQSRASVGVPKITPEVFEVGGQQDACGTNVCCATLSIPNTPPECEKLEASIVAGTWVENSLLVTFPLTISFRGQGYDANTSRDFYDISYYLLDFGDGTKEEKTITPEGSFEDVFITSHLFTTNKSYNLNLIFRDYDGNNSNSCSLVLTPVETPQHYTCLSGSCQLADGAGANECTPGVENVCKYLACTSYSCTLANATGDPKVNEQGCTASGEICGHHLACSNNSCAYVPGTGSNLDNCTLEGAQCGTLPKHYECDGTDGACKQVNNTPDNTTNKCNPDSQNQNQCKYSVCESDNICKEKNASGAPVESSCTTVGGNCGATTKSCETIRIEFVGGFTTHYVGDTVKITAKGKSSHTDGVKSFKFRFGATDSSPVFTCGQGQSAGAQCTAITAKDATGLQESTLTYSLQNTGKLEVYGSACDINDCSVFTR